MAGVGCSCHSKPPLLVTSTTPFEAMAQPRFLSGAKRMELMELPCGRGFCHCQPREGSWAWTGRAARRQIKSRRAFFLNRVRGTIPVPTLDQGRGDYSHKQAQKTVSHKKPLKSQKGRTGFPF